MTHIRNSLTGALEVELTSAEPENAVWSLINAGIEVFNLKRVGELSRRFYITRDQYIQAERIVKGRGENMQILRKTGFHWIFMELPSRIVLMAGFLFLLILTMYFPSRILFVKVEGNIRVPENLILEAAETCGIRFGASRRMVRSEKVKNGLLELVPQLQWAGINTKGCIAVISVEERVEEQAAIKDDCMTKIVAAQDGYILSGTAAYGTILVQPGQSVHEGQLLISGYTDCGSHIRFTKPQGEIYAQTIHELSITMPSDFEQRIEKNRNWKKISLLIRKKRINLWEDSGILDSSCGRMYKEYYLTLPGGFQLPFGLCVETYTTYEMTSIQLSQTEAAYYLTGFAQDYLTERLVAGTILNKTEGLEAKDTYFLLTGTYICTEMIGREQKEQIGETNGQSG